jgi:Leucine-rich repeat (LRR) protein
MLNLRHNQIKRIEGLDNLSKLIYLHLDGNKITKIEGIEELSKLSLLDLDSNPLSEEDKKLIYLTSVDTWAQATINNLKERRFLFKPRQSEIEKFQRIKRSRKLFSQYI